jgi:hypothetical protein
MPESKLLTDNVAPLPDKPVRAEREEREAIQVDNTPQPWLPEHGKNASEQPGDVKMGRISPSPSRAFTPPYSHSLNAVPFVTSLFTRTFTLTFSRSLKKLKIPALIPPDSSSSKSHPHRQ